MATFLFVLKMYLYVTIVAQSTFSALDKLFYGGLWFGVSFWARSVLHVL